MPGDHEASTPDESRSGWFKCVCLACLLVGTSCALVLTLPALVPQIPRMKLSFEHDVAQDMSEPIHCDCAVESEVDASLKLKPKVVVVQADTRRAEDPLSMNSSDSSQSFPVFATSINRMYALRHNYAYRFFSFKDKECGYEQPEFHKINRAWCKLLAIASVLDEGYDTAIFLDTDAFFRDPDVSLEDFLDSVKGTSLPGYNMGADGKGGKRGAGVKAGVDVETASLILTSDQTAKYVCNTGVMIWRNTNSSRKLLQAWWNAAQRSSYSTNFDWDQGGFRNDIYSHKKWQNQVARLPIETMNSPRGRYIRHMFGKYPSLRKPAIRAAISHYFVHAAVTGSGFPSTADPYRIALDTTLWRNRLTLGNWTSQV